MSFVHPSRQSLVPQQQGSVSDAQGQAPSNGGPPSGAKERRRSRSRSPRKDDHRKDRDKRRKSRSRSRGRDKRRSHSRSRSRSGSRERRRKREKKSSGWDKPPDPNSVIGAAAPLLLGTGLPISSTPTQAQPANATQMVQRQLQQDRQARRLYLGNIPPMAQENDIMNFFNQQMANVPERRGIQELACKSVQIFRDRGFAFIEYATAEDANIGMCMDGIQLMGSPLTIRRPKEYVPPATPAPGKGSYAIPGIVSSQVADGPDKIFLGRLPTTLTEHEVRQLVTAFGPIKAFNMVKETGSGLSKGYCFFRYEDPSVAETAIKGLSGIEIGGQRLQCQFASLGAKPKDAPMMGLGGLGLPGLLPGLTGGMPDLSALLPGLLPGLGLGVGGIPGLSGAPGSGLGSLGSSTTLLTTTAATRILCLANMVTEQELQDPTEYEDIAADVREECSKYGQVQSLEIPKPGQRGCGKVFIAYASADQALAAEKAIGGRKFANRTIIASFLSEADFMNKNF